MIFAKEKMDAMKQMIEYRFKSALLKIAIVKTSCQDTE